MTSRFITTFNMKGFLPMVRNAYDSDINRVEPLGSLIFWQEAGWLRWVRRMIRNRMPYTHEVGKHHWGHHFPGGSTGISFDWRHWRPVYRGRTLLHDRVWGVCDRRYIAEIGARETSTNQKVGIGSAHWSPKRGGRGRRAQEAGNIRARVWIRRQIRKNQPCILAGDANQTGAFLGEEVAGKKLQYVQGDVGGGIDFLIFVDSDDFEWEIVRRRVFHGFNSDHEPVRARVRLKPKG